MAVEEINLSQELNGLSIVGHALFFEDAQKKFENLDDLPADLSWQELVKNNVEVGLSTSAYWVKFKIKNTSNKPVEWMLLHDVAFQDLMEVYVHTSYSQQNYLISSLVPFSERPLDALRLGMQETLEAGSQAEVFVRLENLHIEQTSLNMRLYTPEAFSQARESEILVFALFIGLMFSIIIIWLIFAISLNLKRLYIYCGFILGIVIVFADARGVSFKYIYPDLPELHNRLFVTAVFLTAAFSLLFCSKHLQLKNHGFVKWHNTLRYLSWIYFFGAAFTFSNISHDIAATTSMIAATSLSLNLLIAIQVWLKTRLEYVLWFMIAWIFSATAVLVLFANALFGATSHFLVFADMLNYILIFFVFDGILLSLSIARWLQGQEKIRKEAEHHAMHDPMTGLLNRRALNSKLEEILSRERHPETLWLSVIDVDHFKAINDTYGHAAGDEVLKNLAQIIRDHCRLDDLACRFGGEEFVVIMNNIAKQDFEKVMNRLHSSFGNEPTKFGDLNITHTFSAGLSHAVNYGQEEYDELFKRADAALYKAKEMGRNRIEFSN